MLNLNVVALVSFPVVSIAQISLIEIPPTRTKEEKRQECWEVVSTKDNMIVVVVSLLVAMGVDTTYHRRNDIHTNTAIFNCFSPTSKRSQPFHLSV